MLIALVNLLAAYLHPSRGPSAHEFDLSLMLLISLLQELTSIFIVSSLSLVYFGTAFLWLYFLLLTT